MAKPGGREVGRVSVRVLPDTSAFGRSLERYLERLERTLSVNLAVDLDSGDLARADAQLDNLSRDRRVSVGVDVDRSMLDRLEGVIGGVGKGFGGGGLASFGGGGFGTIPVVLAAIAASLPLIATGLLALPAFLTALLAPIAAVALGVKGIARAASVLAEPFERLQSVVSAVFEERLTPIFKQLRRLAVPLAVGLSAVAEGLSDMFGAIVDGLTSKKGAAKVGDILSKIGDAMSKIAPSLGPLTDAFLTLIDAGADAFVEMAPALADITTQFADLVETLSQSGLLADAFELLGKAILGVLGALLVLSIGGAIAAGLINRYIGALGDAFENTAIAIVVACDDIADAVVALPGRIVVGFASFSTTMGSIGGDAVKGLRNGFTTGFSDFLTYLGSIPGLVVSGVGELAGTLYATGLHAGQQLIEGLINGLASKALDLAAKVGEIANDIKDKFPGSPVKDGPLVSWNGGAPGRKLMEMLASGITAGGSLVDSALAGVTSGMAVPALAGSAFVSSDTFAAGGGSSRRGITITNWHDGTGYMEAIADSRVDSASALLGERDRAL